MKDHCHSKPPRPKYSALWYHRNKRKMIRHNYTYQPSYKWHNMVESLVIVDLRTKKIIHNYGDTFRLQVYWLRKTQHAKATKTD